MKVTFIDKFKDVTYASGFKLFLHWTQVGGFCLLNSTYTWRQFFQVSLGQLILLKLRMMEVVVITGAISQAMLQSNHYRYQTFAHLFTGRMSPNQLCQSTEGKTYTCDCWQLSASGCKWCGTPVSVLGGDLSSLSASVHIML